MPVNLSHFGNNTEISFLCKCRDIFDLFLISNTKHNENACCVPNFIPKRPVDLKKC